MKVEMSNYLSREKSKLKKIVDTLSETFDYVSLLGTDTKGKGYGVQRTGSNLSDSMWTERGFVLRIYNGRFYSEYSFNQIEEDLDAFIETLKNRFIEEHQILHHANLKTISYPILQEEAITKSFFSEVKIHPQEVSSKEKIEKLTKIMEEGLSYSDHLIDFRCSFEEVNISKCFISTKKDLEQSYIWTQGSLVAIAKKENKTKFYYDSYAGLKGVELMDEMLEDAKSIVDGALQLLDSDRLIPGEYDIICAPDVAGLIAHEAFGHGVEMDMFVKNRAKALEYLNKPVGSKHVTMHDGAQAASNVSSYLFDDEGTLGGDTKVIDQGILKTGISDVLSAMTLGTQPTGNGKRESFERKAYARMTSTFFSGGHDQLEDMIGSIEKGYLLEGVMSGMEDPKNWGIQCMLMQGKEIVNGKLTGKVVSPVIMTGYVPDVLNAVEMVSEEVKFYGSGACGKGHKEWVKTADGGPYIKTRGRLG
ncbi:MAG: TldD/PmbA family protein [Clostridia bacterium]|nr:TldD/PmbA family protein [Clostridia bacterium]